MANPHASSACAIARTRCSLLDRCGLPHQPIPALYVHPRHGFRTSAMVAARSVEIIASEQGVRNLMWDYARRIGGDIIATYILDSPDSRDWIISISHFYRTLLQHIFLHPRIHSQTTIGT